MIVSSDPWMQFFRDQDNLKPPEENRWDRNKGPIYNYNSYSSYGYNSNANITLTDPESIEAYVNGFTVLTYVPIVMILIILAGVIYLYKKAKEYKASEDEDFN